MLKSGLIFRKPLFPYLKQKTGYLTQYETKLYRAKIAII